MPSWDKTRLPEWLSLGTAKQIAIGAKPHPTERSLTVKGTAKREPKKQNVYGETRTFRARADRDVFGPRVMVQWFTGGPDRGNKWTLTLPAQEILKLAELILREEPNRKAWWDWLKSSEQAIKQEAKESGIDLKWDDVMAIRDLIVKHKESLISPADVIELSRSPKKR